jgi:hypothetical protein
MSAKASVVSYPREGKSFGVYDPTIVDGLVLRSTGRLPDESAKLSRELGKLCKRHGDVVLDDEVGLVDMRVVCRKLKDIFR